MAEDTDSITLDPNESTDETLTWATSSSDEGDFVAEISGETDTETTVVSVVTEVSDGTVTLYDGTDQSTVLTSIDFTLKDNAPSTGTKVPVGFHSSDGEHEFDNARLGDGTTIEDFDDCLTLSDYFDSGDLINFTIEGSGGDCYLKEAGSGYADQVYSSVSSGLLQNYPDWGATYLVEVNVDTGRDAGLDLGATGSTTWKFRAQYKSSEQEVRLRGDWVKDTSKSYDLPTGQQLWKVEFS